MMRRFFAAWMMVVMATLAGSGWSQTASPEALPEATRSPQDSAREQGDEQAKGNQEKSGPDSTSAESTAPQAAAEQEEEAPGEETPVRTFDRQNSVILQAIEPIKAQAQSVTVAVLSSTRKNYVALGTIVDAEGLILTKASELRGDLRCRLSDGRELTARVQGIHEPTDLALLKVEANGLPAAHWSTGDPPAVGYWLITPRPGLTPKLGIVSVLPRAIPSPSGFMGVNLAQADNGVRVTRVLANSPAEKAGVLINDVIIALDGQPKTNQIDLITSVQQHIAGEVVEITLLRDGNERKFKIKLAERSAVDSNLDRSDVQNQMGGRISRRRLGFPMALQHDTTLAPNDCGGPVVDLTGQIVGVNIARAGRVDSLALPAATILSVLEPLRSGELAPAVLYKSEIETVQHRLQEIESEMAAGVDTSGIERELEQSSIREDELQKAIGELEARLHELQAQRATNEQALAKSKTKLDDLQKEKERLEYDLERLQLGDNN